MSTPQGKLSDVYGRKSLLCLAYVVPSLGYLILTLAISYRSLPLFLLSKIPTGRQHSWFGLLCEKCSVAYSGNL